MGYPGRGVSREKVYKESSIEYIGREVYIGRICKKKGI